MSENNQKVVVFGGLNIDYFIDVDRQPQIGETMECRAMKIGYGGKGANQAVAAAKMGAQVTMLAQIGNSDPLAQEYLSWMKEQGVNVDLIVPDPEKKHPTGMAFIYRYPDGNNSIVVNGGANTHFTEQGFASFKDSWHSAVKEADVVMMTRETPLWVMENIAQSCKENLVLDLGGSLETVSDQLLSHCAIISPNETERVCLIGDHPVDQHEELCSALIQKHQHLSILLKNGEDGSTLITHQSVHREPAFKSTDQLVVCDTTAAGDAFTAAFAITRDIKVATGAAFLTCTVKGAAESIPTIEKVKQTFGL